MLKKALKCLLVLSLILTIAGCSSSDGLIGKWVSESQNTIEFKTNGKMSVTLTVMGVSVKSELPYTHDDTTFTITEDGKNGIVAKYTIQGNTLTISGTLLYDGTYTRAK